MNAFELKDLKKSFDNTLIIKGLNLQIKQGEVYGFIGKNGAGKTTTINLLLSLVHKDSGDIIVDNEVVSFTDQDYKKKIGYVPDVPVFPTYMNASDYLKYTLDIYGFKGNVREKVEEVLNFVSLENTKKKISSYSRGMKQRLAIAQALIHDPDILIMDEPTSALDPVGRNDVMNIIMKLKGSKTIFYSTHILDDVEKVCDRIGILHNGELILEDNIVNLQDRFYSRVNYIETTSKPEDLLETIKKTKMVKAFQANNKGVNVKLKDEFRSNDLLRKLSDMDEEIVEYRQVKPTLEDIFIKEINGEITEV